MSARIGKAHYACRGVVGRTKTVARQEVRQNSQMFGRSLIRRWVECAAESRQVAVSAMAFGDQQPIQRNIRPRDLQCASEPQPRERECLLAPVLFGDDGVPG